MIVEPGIWRQEAKNIPYLGLGFLLEYNNLRSALVLGVDSALGFIGNFRLQHYIYKFPASRISPINSWHESMGFDPYGIMAGFYIGTELKSRIFVNRPNIIDQNLHLGFGLENTDGEAVFKRFFIQYRYGLSYTSQSELTYPILQLGMNLRIFTVNE
jgi:hypothetical protein